MSKYRTAAAITWSEGEIQGDRRGWRATRNGHLIAEIYPAISKSGTAGFRPRMRLSVSTGKGPYWFRFYRHSSPPFFSNLDACKREVEQVWNKLCHNMALMGFITADDLGRGN